MTNGAVISKLRRLKSSARELSLLSSERKNAVLRRAAKALIDSQSRLLAANRKDLTMVESPRAKKKTNPAFIDRLRLNSDRIAHMARSLEQVAALPDPLAMGAAENKVLSNGLRLKRIRSPLGIIFMIFESRPNVAVEAFSLAFKAGNVVILKGGRESSNTTAVIYRILAEVFEEEGLSKDFFWGLSDPDRKTTPFLLLQKEWIDVVVPRGGDQLIHFVSENSSIPLIKNDRGLCHVYVHEDADLKMATQIVRNAKTQRPGVCNAMETLLVHESIAKEFLPLLYSEMEPSKVEWLVCPLSFQILKGRKEIKKASAKSWNTEYLDLKMNCRIVPSLDDALRHIIQYSSKHSESIITKSEQIAKRFQAEIDSAVVYWNASTRFTDGFEFGLGGELGISTQKLHVRGPVGLEALTSLRWVVDGNGQIRS